MHQKRPSRFLTAVIILVIAAVALRAALPWILEDYVNRQLAEMEDYDGRVDDIDVALWRGAYQIQGLEIHKVQAEELEPFLVAENIDLSVEWDRLFDGALVGELVFWHPELNLVEAEEDERSQTGEEEDWREHFEELFPFRFNRIEVRDGIVRFRTPGIPSDDALEASQVNGQLRNLNNAEALSEDSFASFDFEGRVLDAPMQLEGQVDPTAEQPTFDMNVTLENLNLPALNPWLKEYLNADAHTGTFELYMELAAAEGSFEGYAKPFAEDVEIFDLQEDSDQGVLRGAWEAALDFAANIFENPEEEEAASRIPISGTIEEPDAGVWRALVNVLRHAFAGSFTRTLEHSISLGNGGAEEREDEDEKEGENE